MEAVDAIKLHSTQQGREVVQSPNRSNANRVVFLCKAQSLPCTCKYKAVLRKSKKKVHLSWGLKQGTRTHGSDLQHDHTCTSRAKITFRELRLTLQSRESHVLPTIKDTRDRIVRDSRITKASVSPFIAQKVRLAEAHQNNKVNNNVSYVSHASPCLRTTS